MWRFEDDGSGNGGVLTIYGDGDFQVNGTAGTATNNRIVVQSGTSAAVVLNDVNINTNHGAALDMRGAAVDLWLEGSNSIATSTYERAGIETTNGHLTINGAGELTALGGNGEPQTMPGGTGVNGGGAGIGGGTGQSSGIIVINGGTITAIGGGDARGAATLPLAAGIGGGAQSDSGDITINNGNITTSSHMGAGIGGGFNGGAGGNITFNGGNVNSHSDAGAGIGGGGGFNAGSGGNIVINDGSITANSQTGAGIGGGSGQGGNGGSITINGGRVHAVSTLAGAGIGGGQDGGGGSITITDGIVTASGSNGGAAIGGGPLANSPTNMTISGGLVEIGQGQSVGSNMSSSSTNIAGGNLSIHNPNEIRPNPSHANQEAFRIEIFLHNGNNYVPFGAHTDVAYTIGGLTVNAITDSQGRLFMYLPVSMASNQGSMDFNGQTFRENLTMMPDHDNRLVLRIDDGNGNNNGGNGNQPQPPSGHGHGLWIQAGPNSGQGIYITIEAMDATSLGLIDADGDLAVDVFLDSGADIAPMISILDNALTLINANRAHLGAMQNRLEFTMQNNNIASENLSAAESRIRDADMAKEMMELMKSNVLQQAATVMLAQANQAPNNVLQLLQT
jgi:flagellin-like hook-associated protein FlgL